MRATRAGAMSAEVVAAPFPGYRLLDSGGGRKLEEIAGHLVIRPSPQALWRPRLDEARWRAARSECVRRDDGGGVWRHQGAEPQGLTLRWERAPRPLTFALRLTAFGHCGVFAEQEPVWRWLAEAASAVAQRRGRPAKGLNLFAYTGAASLAMAAAGAQVYHVDSAKGVLAWGRENLQASGLGADAVRFVHEDALAFLQHSRRKGFRYDLVLADPPSWGHGVDKGAVWRFEEQVAELAAHCRAVLDEGGAFLLSAHTPGVQARALANLLAAEGFPRVVHGEFGVAHADDERVLPAGVFACGVLDGGTAPLGG